ncbi:MAG: hypothetical protein U5O39_04660 [Gammaproteobacteria bacterium]|nr:hypothetical protein [Gammaproteobacteria bacterium]
MYRTPGWPALKLRREVEYRSSWAAIAAFKRVRPVVAGIDAPQSGRPIDHLVAVTISVSSTPTLDDKAGVNP